jgi:hypothetical protein
MRRREFVTLLGGAAAWPFGARAQQPAMTVIGLLSSVTAREWAPFIAAFLQGLNEVGFCRSQAPRSGYPRRRCDDRRDRLHSCKIAEWAGAPSRADKRGTANVELDRVKTSRAIDPVSQDRVSEETIRNLGKLCADHNVMARTNA